ncbi:hypothetical protein [Streptomyces sp. NBC_00102]|uniref:hypothetical protein n=1 Tax=Streptomyces sp. NBC_00102 TaxID=2975652 RepID=UPI002257D190|nr:hypothetical protein [Streptomyces sp. NBC_00102]MCX5399654.1 hypothetical protein [Streptomyces sp. NBC_00102]
MVDTHARRYLLVVRRMFWAGVLLLGLGLAVGWAAKGHRASAWECDPTCRPATSTTWRAVSDGAMVSVVLGATLAAAAFLMIMLRRPRAAPDTGSQQSAVTRDDGGP